MTITKQQTDQWAADIDYWRTKYADLGLQYDQLRAEVEQLKAEKKVDAMNYGKAIELAQLEIAALRDDNARLQRDLEFAAGAEPKMLSDILKDTL